MASIVGAAAAGAALRALRALRRLEVGHPADLPEVRAFFGAMHADDWRRWAWRHTDHHVQQFGP